MLALKATGAVGFIFFVHANNDKIRTTIADICILFEWNAIFGTIFENKGNHTHINIMKSIITLVALVTTVVLKGQILLGDKTEVSFYSYTPVENISARTTSVTEVINLGTGDFVFKLGIKTFDFPNDLMEEHFNENYMESGKYPNATFNGKYTSATPIDIKKDGSYPVMATGVIEIHGVKQTRTIPATISVKGGVVSLDSKFKVKLVDFNIEVPTVVFSKIAEEIDVHIKSTLKSK